MYRFRFWSPHELPDLISPAAPNIGINEKVHPPLYYAVAAMPVRWLLAANIEQQLYAARMVGIGLYVLIVASAWRIASIVAPGRLGMILAPPLIVAVAPSFADQMSSLNGDVLVN